MRPGNGSAANRGIRIGGFRGVGAGCCMADRAREDRTHARAIAEDLDLPVFVFDLASMYNNELQEAWSTMLSEVPCMALIEDIDAVFDGRRNASSGNDKQALTFDCLLNCLDGIQRADGLLVVISTNRIDKIDPALGIPDEHTGSSRPAASIACWSSENSKKRAAASWPVASSKNGPASGRH